MLIENRVTVIEDFLKQKHGSDFVGLGVRPKSPMSHTYNKTQRSATELSPVLVY